MEAKEQEQLVALQSKVTLCGGLQQQWLDGLKRILHESNSAKVTVCPCFEFLFVFIRCSVMLLATALR